MPASSPSSRLQRDLLSDFNALCDCGGRRAGTASERRALDYLRGRLQAIGATAAGGPAQFRSEPVTYAGWTPGPCSLSLEDGTPLAAHPLLGAQSTPPDGLVAEVVDLGRGTEEDFARHADRIPGRIALVRHEYMFSAQTIHRRRKLGWAMERGAAGFLIAHPGPEAGPVAGSSGRAGGTGIPAAGIDFESSSRLKDRKVRLLISGTDHEAATEVLVLDLPGKTDRFVVLSAHLDGHDLAESALDNASGVAVALAIARVAAPYMKGHQLGLRLCLFSAEEWALAGSRQYLDRMAPAERAKMALNLNLDTVAGDDRLTALTSGFPALDAWVRKLSAEKDLALETHLPLMQNSDHYNFARHGIPALRLVAGFDRPESDVRHVLTRADARAKAVPAQLANAFRVAAKLVEVAVEGVSL